MDAGTDGPTCAARFNFEGGSLHGAFINTNYQTAFTAIANGADAYCGGGSLRITTVLPSADNKGELIIPLGQTENVSGRTFSMALKTTPAAPADAYALVFLVPSYTVVAIYNPLPAAWTTRTMTIPAADGGTSMTTGISVQLLSGGTAFSGSVSVDEVDIR